MSIAKLRNIRGNIKLHQETRGTHCWLDRRELSLVKTEALLVLALKYGEAMKSEQEKLEL